MIEVMTGRVFTNAWRLVWQHKILWLYALIFHAISHVQQFAHLFQSPSLTMRILVVGSLVIISYIATVFVEAGFYVNALAWLDNKKKTVIQSFMFGDRILRLLIWGIMLGVASVLMSVLLTPTTSGSDLARVSGGAWGSFGALMASGGLTLGVARIIIFVTGVIFFIGTLYVTIILSSTQQSLMSAIKRSFVLVLHTLWRLLGVILEAILYVILYQILLVVSNMVVLMIVGSAWNIEALLQVGLFAHWSYTLIIAPLMWLVFGTLLYAALVVLYKRQLVRERQDVLGQIPPYIL